MVSLGYFNFNSPEFTCIIIYNMILCANPASTEPIWFFSNHASAESISSIPLPLNVWFSSIIFNFAYVALQFDAIPFVFTLYVIAVHYVMHVSLSAADKGYLLTYLMLM